MGKLQEVEGIIKGMLMTLDIRIGTDIVVIKSSSLLLNLVYTLRCSYSRIDWPPESPDNQYHLNK